MHELNLPFERVVAFHPSLARHFGNDINTAIYFQQIIFWSDKGSRKDGFVYKSKTEFEEETTLTRKQQDRCRAKLEKLGYIEVKNIKVNGAPTLHYRTKISLNHRNSPKGTNGIAPKGLMEKPQRDYSLHITENTTDISTPPSAGADEKITPGGMAIMKAFIDNGLVHKTNKGQMFGTKRNQEAANELAELYGEDKVVELLAQFSARRNEEYMPQFTYPYQLLEKWPQLVRRLSKQDNQIKFAYV